MAFESLSERLQNAIKMFRGTKEITEEDLKAPLREVRMALLEADVNFKVVKNFVAKIKERALGAEIQQNLSPSQQIIKIVDEELTELLGGTQAKLTVADKPPTIIMLVGLQGTGKTTTVGKLAFNLKKKKKSPLLVAADVYRPAAITQLQVAVAGKSGAPGLRYDYHRYRRSSAHRRETDGRTAEYQGNCTASRDSADCGRYDRPGRRDRGGHLQ